MKKRYVTPKTRTCLLTAAGFVLLALLLLLGRSGLLSFQRGESVKTPEERIEFLSDCGWQVEPSSEQSQIIHIPEDFSPVYEEYNSLQLQQGYDLKDYAGQDCAMYTYTVLNYPDETQTVLANLYVYRDRVIGGDIHSTSLDGFMIGLR